MSWVDSVEEVSDSAKLRITSKKDGTEPVVMALIRGMVIVGDAACAVNGIAEPSLIKLQVKLAHCSLKARYCVPLSKFEARSF